MKPFKFLTTLKTINNMSIYRKSALEWWAELSEASRISYAGQSPTEEEIEQVYRTKFFPPASDYLYHDINNKLNVKDSKKIGGLLFK